MVTTASGSSLAGKPLRKKSGRTLGIPKVPESCKSASQSSVNGNGLFFNFYATIYLRS
jgi:hypothetical protein